MLQLSIIFWFILGLCLGSFSNVCVYRLPLEKSILFPRSYCPQCKKEIYWYHNIPLISYLFLKGKCATCRENISLRYPLIELSFGIIFSFIYYWYRFSVPHMIVWSLFTFCLVTIAVVDFDHQLIPNQLSLGLFILGVVYSPFNFFLGPDFGERLIQSLGGSVIGFSLMLGFAYLGEWIWKKEALGGGDIKLMAGIGAFLGIKSVFMTLFISSLLGTIIAFFLLLSKKISRGNYLPFGPFLVFGAWIYWISFEFSVWDKLF